MARLDPLVPDCMNEAQRHLYDVITGGPRNKGRLIAADGSLRGPFDPMLRSPAVGGPLQALGAAIRFETQLAADARELAILLTSVHWRCRFEWDAHLPLAVAAGLDEAALVPLWDGGSFPSDEPAYRLIEASVREVFADGTLGAESFTAAVDALGERETFELLALVGYYSTLAIIMNSFDIT